MLHFIRSRRGRPFDAVRIAGGGRVEPLEPRRLMAAGDLDPSFGAGGKVVTDLAPYSEDARELAPTADGGFLMAGSYTNRYLLAKYLADGRLDPAFGSGGTVIATNVDTYAGASTMAVQPDGKILTAGADFNGGTPGSNGIIFRYTAAGQPDTTWSGDGIATFSASSLHTAIRALAVQPDGKIVAAGDDGRVAPNGGGLGDWVVARFNANGTLDTTFSGDGWLTIPFPGFGTDSEARGVALQPDGKIVVTGSQYHYSGGSNTGIGVARLTPGGVLDPTFDTDGRAVFNYGLNAGAAGEDVAVRDGKIYVAGTIGGRPAVYRLDAAGAPDASFGGGDGLFHHPADAAMNFSGATDMDFLPDGHIVLGGTHATGAGTYFRDQAVMMLKADGTPEPEFGNGGIATADFGAGENAGAVAVDVNGKIVAAGRQVTPTDRVDIVIARFEGFARPATVTGVFASGREWAPAFKQYLEERRLGEAELGFDVTPRPTAVVPPPLPWVNLDRVTFTFSGDVPVARDSLSVRGARVANYNWADGPAGFSYDRASGAATWTFARPLAADRLLLELRDPALAGGGLTLRVDVLPGDATGDRAVLANDYSEVKKRFFKTTTTPPQGAGADYSAFHDVDGSGSVLANDYSEVKNRFFSTLPNTAPAAAAGLFADRKVGEPSESPASALLLT